MVRFSFSLKRNRKILSFYVYSTAKARLILLKSWKVLIWDLRGFWIIWWSRIGRGLVNNRINYLNLEISGVKTCDRISTSWDHYKTEELFAVSKHISFFFITISEVYCDFFSGAWYQWLRDNLLRTRGVWKETIKG